MNKKLITVALATIFLVGCSWLPKPPDPTEPPVDPPVDPPYTESCQALLDQGLPWCHVEGMTCGDCLHNPTLDPKHCEKAADCPVEPPPVDPPPVDPPVENQWFPVVPQDQITAVRGNPGNYGSALNKAMATLTGCYVGQEPCPVSLHVDLWFQAVCKQLHAGVRVGDEIVKFSCGRHVESPLGQVCPPGDGCSDQISIKRGSFCDGDFHENYRVINPNEDGVRWYPGAKLDGWNVDCTGATWPEEPGTEPPPVDPPPSDGVCVDPNPAGRLARFNLKHHNNYWDSTYQISDRAYCDEVAVNHNCPGFAGRSNCPVRCEGDVNRQACEEQQIGTQQWWCNGEPTEPKEGNNAQAICKAHVKTCTEDGRTCNEADW